MFTECYEQALWMVLSETINILRKLPPKNYILFSGCPRKFHHRFMYIVPSSGEPLPNLNSTFIWILWSFEAVFWCLEWECSTVHKIDENSFKSTNTCTMALNIANSQLTSTDGTPLKPKSWSLKGRPLRLSAVSLRYLAMSSFWALELVATVMGYHICTKIVYRKEMKQEERIWVMKLDNNMCNLTLQNNNSTKG